MTAIDPVWLDELRELLRIPSVSADPAHKADVVTAAEWVADKVRRSGGEAELVPYGERPMVVGEIRASNGAESAPTILCYGHFDVQPPAPLDLWESDPFEATIRDEWLYARGVADDKGQLWMLLHAAGLLAAESALPVNIRIVSDGEEEVGGQSIVEFLERDERGADACVIFDGGMENRNLPAISIATRGLAAFNIRVRTGARDLHSGMYGNAAMNAIHALNHTLTGILARDGRVPDALRAGIAPVTDEERAGWDAQPAGADVLREAGAVPYDPKAADEFYLRTTAETSVEVNGILGGKPGLKNTTVVSEAQANFTVRLAPGQDPKVVAPEVERLLREAAPEGATIEIEELPGSTRPGLVDANAPVIKIGQDAFEHAFGIRPILTRSGGTLPIMPALADKGIPTILTGFALPESNVHSPNERMLVEFFPRGVDTIRELYTRLGEL
ncbi:MAG: M20/M25/M40 family metallo-hydrolase [Actinomycetota bacterium]|nr:M20/M25/M40 family metallo-hydrolase [Actinomycetota bacterium]